MIRRPPRSTLSHTLCPSTPLFRSRIPMLIGFGAPAYVATLGFISWRLLSFWAPIPLGTLAYVSIRLRQPGVRPDRDDVADELGEVGREHREAWTEWADRHAIQRRP